MREKKCKKINENNKQATTTTKLQRKRQPNP